MVHSAAANQRATSIPSPQPAGITRILLGSKQAYALYGAILVYGQTEPLKYLTSIFTARVGASRLVGRREIAHGRMVVTQPQISRRWIIWTECYPFHGWRLVAYNRQTGRARTVIQGTSAAWDQQSCVPPVGSALSDDRLMGEWSGISGRHGSAVNSTASRGYRASEVFQRCRHRRRRVGVETRKGIGVPANPVDARQESRDRQDSRIQHRSGPLHNPNEW